MPSGSIEQQNGVGALGDVARYLVEVKLHGECVSDGQCERRAFTPRRADRAEEIGVVVTLVGRLARSRSPLRPLANLPVLLPNPGFVLEPNLYRFARGDMGKMRLQRLAEVFLNAAIVSAFWPGWRGRALMCEKPSILRSLPIVRS